MTPEELRDHLRARPDYQRTFARYAEVPEARETMGRVYGRLKTGTMSELDRKGEWGIPEVANAMAMQFVMLAKKADDYYWTPEMAQAVFDSSKSMPLDWKLEPNMLPSASGFMLFGGWSFDYLMSDGDSAKIIGMGWHPFLPPDRPDITGVFMHPLFKYPRLPALASVGSEPLLYDCSLAQSRTVLKTEQTRPHDVAIRFFGAAVTWLCQRIVIPREAALDRVTAKRLERSGAKPRPIKVIMLRREERPVTDHQGDKHVEWTCQWIVSGHWRNQWYPKSQQNRPKYILPYVKGPDGKPLMTDPAKLFVVNR